MEHPLFQLTAAALALSALAVTAALPTGAVTDPDPLVSLSYLNGTYRDGLLSDVDVAVAAAKKQLSASFTSHAEGLASVEPATPKAVQNDYEALVLSAGQTASVRAGGELLLVSGKAAAAEAGLVDATEGAPVAKGAALKEDHLYIASAAASVQAAGSCSVLVK